MNRRTPFVVSSALVTLALGGSAWLECYRQEAARSDRRIVMQKRDAGAQSEQLANAPVVEQLPAGNQ
jgi:hypothetical protein